MATFSDLQTEVQTLLIDTPAAIVSLVPKFVNRAIKKLEVKHNFKIMESSLQLTTTQFTRTLGARPGDWKQARGKPYYSENLGSTRDMFYTNVANGEAQYGTNASLSFGDPRLVAEDEASGTFLVYPYPDGLSDYDSGEYNVVIPYWAYLPDLILTADTNWFTTNAEQWIVYKAVSEGFYANEDESRAQLWEARSMKEYGDVVLTDKVRRLSELDTLVPHLGALRPHTQE